MSSYVAQTKNPETGQWHEALWRDDYFGRHQYGVIFPDGTVFDPSETDLEVRRDED